VSLVPAPAEERRVITGIYFVPSQCFSLLFYLTGRRMFRQTWRQI
jgi:hypothetical protein